MKSIDWDDVLGVAFFSLAALLILALAIICWGIYEEDRAADVENERNHLETLRSLDEIGRGMNRMAETAKGLLEDDIERLETEEAQLRKRNQALKALLERLRALDEADEPLGVEEEKLLREMRELNEAAAAKEGDGPDEPVRVDVSGSSAAGWWVGADGMTYVRCPACGAVNGLDAYSISAGGEVDPEFSCRLCPFRHLVRLVGWTHGEKDCPKIASAREEP